MRLLTSRIGRFLGYWVGMTGMIASTSTCPCCGQAACPVGVASASAMGAVAAFLLTAARRLFHRHHTAG